MEISQKIRDLEASGHQAALGTRFFFQSADVCILSPCSLATVLKADMGLLKAFSLGDSSDV